MGKNGNPYESYRSQLRKVIQDNLSIGGAAPTSNKTNFLHNKILADAEERQRKAAEMDRLFNEKMLKRAELKEYTKTAMAAILSNPAHSKKSPEEIALLAISTARTTIDILEKSQDVADRLESKT